MEKLITDRDMKNQIAEALGEFGGDFDAEAIFEEIHRVHGLIDIEDMDTVEFWQIVEHHDLVNVPPSRSRRQPPVYGE